MILKNSLGISHEYAQKIIKEGDLVVDATAGNGNDTLFLSRLVGDGGRVYAFDIQEVALQSTKARLEDAGLAHRAELIHDGHQNIDRYVSEEIKAAIFNLGYLPKGDHSIGTRAETTIEAVNKCLQLLSRDGLVIVVVYYGGDSGFDEKEAFMEYIKNLDCRKYAVLVHDFVNQINCPPIAICIEKILK